MDVPLYLGSRSTFTKGAFGGHQGQELRTRDVIPIGEPCSGNFTRCSLPRDLWPQHRSDWAIGVLPSPMASPDYLTDEDIRMLHTSKWEVHHNSNRTEGEVQLHVHRADHFVEGHSPHTSYEARAPWGPLVYGCRQGVESRGLQLGDVGGDGDAPEFRLPDGLVGVLEEQGDPTTPAHRAAYLGAAHDRAQGFLVRLRQVTVPRDVDADVRFWYRWRSGPRALPDCTSQRWRGWT